MDDPGAPQEREPIPAGSAVGKIFVMRDGTRWKLQLNRTSQNVPGRLMWILQGDPYHPQAVPFQAGTYVMGTGKAVEIDGTGNIVEGSGRTLTQDERDAYFGGGAATAGGAGGGGGGGAVPPYTSTQSYVESQRAWEAEQTKRQQEWQAEQERLARLNQRRLQLMGDLRALAQTAAQVRQQYRADLMALEQAGQVILGETLGKQPIRGAIMSQGLMQQGTTPMEAYRSSIASKIKGAGRLAGQLGEPLPAPNLGADIAGLEEQMPLYEEWQNPPDLPQLPTTPPIGMAQGGTIEGQVMAVDGQRVGTTGGVGYGVLTGEGEWNGDEEVIHFKPNGEVEVIPLAGGAAGGAKLDYNVSTIEQSLSSLWEHLGFNRIPRARRTESGALRGMTHAFKRPLFERLGIQPRYIKQKGTRKVYFVEIGPDGRPIRRRMSKEAIKAAKFSPRDLVEVVDASRFGRLGDPLMGRPPIIEPGVSERRFPRPSAPVTVDVKGKTYLLPAPRMIAALYPTLSASVKTVIDDLFDVAGYTMKGMGEEMAAFTPAGTATRRGPIYG